MLATLDAKEVSGTFYYIFIISLVLVAPSLRYLISCDLHILIYKFNF